MGILQRAMQTFDTLKELDDEGMLNSPREPLGDIGCKVTNIGYILRLDSHGNLVQADKTEKGCKMPIPVTEKSEARTSGASPHPFHEQVCYASASDVKKHALYMEMLRKFDEHSPDDRIKALISYLEKGTLDADLEKLENASAKKGKAAKKIDVKSIIYWTFEDMSDKDCGGSIISKFQDFYMDEVVSKREKALCQISGRMDYPTHDHPKSVLLFEGNAKLISADTADNPFKYLGRFTELDEALTVSYTASQKMHAALRWLCSNIGVINGKTCFICWDVGMHRLPAIDKPLIAGEDREETDTDPLIAYRKELERAVLGYKNTLGEDDDILIASFTPSVKGRFAISHFSEIKATEFLDRLSSWDLWCSAAFTNGKAYSPSLYDIAKYTYGIPNRTGIMLKDSDTELAVTRLISCRTEGRKIPEDIARMIADKAGMLGLYPTTGGVTSPRNRMMYVTCSVLRKYYKDHRKEEYDMSLEKDKKDRSYQYGRLLAVYEKMEWDTYNEDDKKKRMTNALRIQSTFSKRPCYASAIIREQLQKGYIQKLSVGTRTYYDKLIGEIMEKISGFPDTELNKPLEGSYLIGYYMQRNALFTGKTKDTGNGNEAKDGTVIIEG